MKSETKNIKINNVKKKLIMILVLALVVTAIIPLGVMGSSDATIDVKFMVDGDTYEEVEVNVDENESTHYFDKSLYPEDPAPEEGYIFEGWSNGSSVYKKDSQQQLPIYIPNVTVNAVFKKDESFKNTEQDEKDSNKEINKDEKKSDESTSDSDNVRKKDRDQVSTNNLDNKTKKEKQASNTDNTVKVSFYLDGNDNDPYYSETLEKDTIIESWPSDPTEKEGNKFLYWFDAEAADKEGAKSPFFTKSTIAKDVKLVAEYGDGHMVTFHDSDGTILDEIAVEDDQTVNVTKKKVDLDAGQVVDYWYIGGGNTKYDFNSKVTENLKLYPHVTQNSVVYFVTNGTYIKPQVVKKNDYAVKPGTDPIRAGYTFKGWSSSQSEFKQFNFGSDKITEDMTYVYAHWQPGKTTYTINFWNEKPNIDDPGAFGYAPWNYELVYSVEKEITTDQRIELDKNTASTIYNTGGDRVKNLLNYSDFQNADISSAAGDGSTVINVSYNRTPYTFNIDPRANVANADKTADMVVGGQTVTYASITAKLGQDIRNLWPSKVTRQDGKNLGLINFSGYAGLANPNQETPLSPAYINQFMNGSYTKYAKPTKTVGNPIPQWGAVNSTEQRWYYFEDLDQNNASGDEYNNGKTTKKYTLSEKSALNQQATNIGSLINNGNQNVLLNWSGKDTEGFVAVRQENKNMPANRKIVKATDNDIFDGGFTQKEYDENGGGKNLFIFKYYMERQVYDLKLVVNGGKMPSKEQSGYEVAGNGDLIKKYRYEEQLSKPGEPTKDNYVFDGWYTDPTFVESSKVSVGSGNNVDLKSMPSSNLTLYARFVGDAAEVQFKDGDKAIKTVYTNIGKDVDPAAGFVTVDGIDYGKLTIDQEVPGRGIFKGWFYQPVENADEVEFYKSSFPVTQTLYEVNAKWAPVQYGVKFINGEDQQSVENGKYDMTIRSNKNTLTKNQRNLPKVAKEVGYTYTWNLKNDGSGSNFSSNTVIKGDTNVYLIKTPNRYKAKFDLNGGDGTTPKTQTVVFKNPINNPSEVPERKGYIFDGWYKEDLKPADPLNGTKWDFVNGKIGAEDMTLYAGWKTYEYTVRFDVNLENVTLIDDVKVKSPDTKINNLPAEPEKTGYVFDGWNTKADGTGEEYDGNDIVTEDITVYGKWKEKVDDKETTPPAVVPGVEPEDETETTEQGINSKTNNNNKSDNDPSGTSGNTDALASDQSSIIASNRDAANKAMEDGTVPTTNLGDREVPLFNSGFGSWALVNLILVIAGILMVLILIARAVIKKNGNNDRIENDEVESDDRTQKTKKVRLSWLIASIVFAVGGIILFLLTQDMNMTMVLVDMWTIANAFLFVATLISAIFVIRKEKEEAEKQEITAH